VAFSLWWASLDVSREVQHGLAACLAPAERRRAEGLARPRDRDRFVAARGWLRRVLARELRCAPEAVPIAAGAHGRPVVAGCALRFSASRSAGAALFATSWTTEVGVDVEAVRPDADVAGLAARFFSDAERRALAGLPARDRTAASFQCWTRKEAYGKALGVGLGYPLGTVDVWSGGPDPSTVDGWSVLQVAAPAGFAAAVAASGAARAPAPREAGR
jgi:4'-phosphopantetheinyl transferase